MKKQEWEVGKQVDVGFVKDLTVLGILPPFSEENYLLGKHGVYYTAKPYGGLQKITEQEAEDHFRNIGKDPATLQSLSVPTPKPPPGLQAGFPAPLSAPAPALSPKQTPQPGFPAPLSTASSAMHVMPRIQPWSPPQQAGFPAPLAAPQSPATAMALSNIPGFPSATTPTPSQGGVPGPTQGGTPMDHVVSRLWMIIQLLEDIRDNTGEGKSQTRGRTTRGTSRGVSGGNVQSIARNLMSAVRFGQAVLGGGG